MRLLWVSLALLLISRGVTAQPDCEDVFPDAAQTFISGGKLKIEDDAKIIGSPDNILATDNLDASVGSCGASACTSSGLLSAQSTYSSFPGGSDVNITADQYLAPGDYGKLEVDDGFVLQLGAGDYTFDDTFKLKKDAQISIQGGGTTRIYSSNKDMLLDDRSSIVLASANDFLFVYAEKKISIEKEVQVHGFFYSVEEIILGDDTALTGSISGGEITLERRASVTFDAGARNNTDFDAFCKSPPPVLDITAASTASTCVGHNVLLRVCTDASCSALNTSYTGTIALQTSTGNGDWTGSPTNGTFSPGAADSGEATFTFAAGNAGSVTLQLNNTRAQSLTITGTDTLAPIITDTTANIAYSDNAFVIADIDSLVEGPAGADVAVAGRLHRYQIQMVQRDTSQSPANCAIASGYNNPAQPLKVWIQRSAELIAAADPSINATVMPEAQPATTNIALDFSAGGSALFDLQTSDVGQFTLEFIDDSRVFANNTDIAGSSNQLTVRPFGLDIDFEIGGLEDRASNGTTGASYAADANGSVYASAGTPFTTEVTAVRWQAADDADNNGVPDAGADLSDNAQTASFGLESSAEQVNLTHTLVEPAGGAAGTLSGVTFSGFVGGVAQRADVSWSEVGVIDMQAQLGDSDYLASGSNTIGSVSNVGRFVPAQFSLAVPAIAEACAVGVFSYMGQPLEVSYNLSAENASGGITTNYRDDFIKLDSSQGSLDYGGIDLPSATNLSLRLAPDAASYIAATTFLWGPNLGVALGTAELSTRLLLTRSATPDGPYATTLGVLASDADSIANTPLDLDVDGGGNDFTTLRVSNQRYGRVFLENAYGPEARNLDVPFIAEYFNQAIGASGAFVPNAQDGCTPMLLGDFAEVAGSYTANLDAADTDPVGVSAANYLNGRGAVTMSAAGNGNDGSVDIEFTVADFLRYDWDADVLTVDTSPVNTATFGSFRGNDRIVYRREVLQ